MRTLVIVLALAACSSSSKPTTTEARPPSDLHGVGTAENLEVMTEEVSFTVGARTIGGTLTRPNGSGTWPAVLLLAGSGPTDRDWNSALIPTKNGSGSLLATELSKHGAIVLRFDKAGTGKNPGPPLPEWTLDMYRDEALAALALLRARADVRGDRVFVAGHSEGGLHATRLAQVAKPPLSGVIYLSSVSRTMSDTILAQLEAQLRNPLAMLSERAIEMELTSLRQAFTDFHAGKHVDPQQASKIPQVQQLVAAVVDPATAKLTRDLVSFDNAVEAPKLDGPFFVSAGGKDVQIDPERDGKRLEKALHAAGKDVTFHLSPDADHVLKHETKTLDEIRANLQVVQDAYNADGRVLDADFTASLIAWLGEHT